MCVDLDLFVLHQAPREGGELAGVRSIIPVERDAHVFDQIEKSPWQAPEDGACVHVFELPPGASIACMCSSCRWWRWCSDEGLEELTEDPFGQPLTYTYAAELRRLEWPEDGPRWNRAVKAFLEALPDETAIVFYWC